MLKSIKIGFKMMAVMSYFTGVAFAFEPVCESHTVVSDVLKQAKIKEDDRALIDCKIDPQNDMNVIMAYAPWFPENADEGAGDYRLYLLKFNKNNLKLTYQYQVAESLISDAISLDSIQLDTANYKINDSNRALGLRLKYFGHSQPNPFSMNVLNLYDLKNKKKVLDSLMVERYRAETDTRCNADVEKRISTLSMQNTQSNQSFDILVKSRIDRSIFQGTSENCKEIKKTTTSEKFSIKFDGQRYQIPKQFKDDYHY